MKQLSLPDGISSHQDLAGLIVDVQSYAQWSRHESVKKKVGAKKSSEAPPISPEAAQVIREWEAKQSSSHGQFEALIKTLTEYKKTAPSLTITLAAPAPRPVKKELVSWCRKNIAPNVLVSFQFNSGLLGGIVIRSGSHVFDGSFRRQILQARSKFPEVLRSV